MADTVQLTSPSGVTVTVAETAAVTLTQMGYVRTDEPATPKPKTTRRRSPRKTKDTADTAAPSKGAAGPFG